MDIAVIKRELYGSWDDDGVPSHVLAFSRFVSPKLKHASKTCAESVRVPYQETAISGFNLALGEDEETNFLNGAEHLSGRSYFTGGKAERFAIDGVALLGVALGYRALRHRDVDATWFLKLVEMSIDALQDDPWHGSFARAAKMLVQDKPLGEEVDDVLAISIDSALGRQVSEERRVRAWQQVVEHVEDPDPSRKAAFQGVYEASVAALARLPVHGAGVSELVEVLEGVAASMSNWTFETKRRVKGVEPEQWRVLHEYHVQNLLWTVLRPIFPDLEDEESLKKLGHTTPRADLGVPSLGTIVEVKFLRNKGQSQLKKLTDEIAADRSLYLRDGTGYNYMIAFVWDECRQTEEYRTLKNGLESLDGIEKVIMLPKPAKMDS
ncbi:MAG: hypothetical protein AAFR02_00705 [Pseudomonadota bacterium]